MTEDDDARVHRTAAQRGARGTAGNRIVLLLLTIALAGCASAQPPSGRGDDPMLARVDSTARRAVEEGRIEEASRRFREALDRARYINDGPSIALSAHNLAACLLMLGRTAEASPLIAEALHEHRRLGMPAWDTRILEIKAARLRGSTDEARRLTARMLSALPPDAPDFRAQIHLIQAQIACDLGDARSARSALDRATEILPLATDPSIHAAAAGAAGRARLLEGRPLDAAVQFDRESHISRQYRQYRAMALALRSAGEAYRDAGRPDDAADRFYRAARTLFAQGDIETAMESIESAAGLRDVSPDLAERTTALREEIKTRSARE